MKQQEKKTGNGMERTTFFIGLFVLIALLGYLSYKLSQPVNNPAHLVITSTYNPLMEHYGFEINIKNTGGTPAKNATVNLQLFQNGKRVETGTLPFDYIPVGSEIKAWLIFHKKRNPGDSLVVSSITFIEP